MSEETSIAPNKAQGLIGRKIGMTRVFDENGRSVPVTVIHVEDNRVVQVKTKEKDGYSAVQVGYDRQKKERLSKPVRGHYESKGVETKKRLHEFRYDSDDGLPELGALVPVSLFSDGQYVDVIGVTKGKGFQGVVKRYNFGGLPQTHGSMMHRRPGGIGCGTDPGRVWKNKEMPGRHGTYRRTVQNLKVVAVRERDNVLLISGAVPGHKGGYVMVRPAVKKNLPSKS